MTLESKEDKKVVNEKTKIVIDDCFLEESSGTLKCRFCPGIYKREGNLKNHVESKHNLVVELVCKCGQISVETTRYCRHKNDCKK